MDMHYRLDRDEFKADHTIPVPKKNIAVVMINGLTFPEIDALRLLSNDPSYPYHITMFTTHLMNGNKLMHSATESDIAR